VHLTGKSCLRSRADAAFLAGASSFAAATSFLQASRGALNGPQAGKAAASGTAMFVRQRISHFREKETSFVVCACEIVLQALQGAKSPERLEGRRR